MFNDDTTADCTRAGLTDANLEIALAMLPATTKDIILNDNVGKKNPLIAGVVDGPGITMLKDSTFQALLCPDCVEALIFDYGELATVEAGAFSPLINLEVLSLNHQKLTSLDGTQFSTNTKLKELSIVNSDPAGGFATFQTAWFSDTLDIERIVLSGHLNLVPTRQTIPPQLLLGLTKLKTLILSGNMLVDPGVDVNEFKDLESLEILDLSNNQLTTAEDAWFKGDGTQMYCPNLRQLFLHNNRQMFVVDAGIFDNLPLLETVTLHDTLIRSIRPGEFGSNPNMISYTVSPLV
jgi:hypothetical protein